MSRDTKAVLVWVLVLALIHLVHWDIPRYQEGNSLSMENAVLCTDIERQKAAMFNQGIWYYRTTVLGQCLPQE